MNLIASYPYRMPGLCLITDDPYRVKMIAAHYLDKVHIFSEIRGQVGLTGEFDKVPVVIMSTGVGKTSTMAYLSELCSKYQIRRVVYLGDCITAASDLSVGSILHIDKAYENGIPYHASNNLLQYVKTIIADQGIEAYERVTATDDNYLIDKKYDIYQEAKILDFTTAAIYGLNRIYSNIEALSILIVCENIATYETIEEARRQSGGYTAIRLALQTLIYENT